MSGERESTVHRLATLRERLSSGMDRREFLRTAGAAGYGLGMAHLLGVDEFLATDDGEVPVVTALVREDPNDPWSLTERTRSVPADWYARVSKAFELHEKLAQASVTGYLASAVTPGSYRQGTASITVEASTEDLDQVYTTLRRLFGDFSFDIEAIEDDIDDLEDHGPQGEPTLAVDIDDGRVPGGVQCETGNGFATLTPALYQPDGEHTFFATAEHAYYDQNASESSLYLSVEDDDPIELGGVRYDHPVADVVAVEPSGDLTPSSEIQGAEPSQVVGQFTRWGLADLAARGQPLEKMGSQTGYSSGQISGIDAITCFTDDFCRRGQVRWGDERDLTDGDSGSVAYHPDPEAPDDGILVASFNNARTWWPGQSFVWGIAAYQLTNKHGYHF